MRTQIIGKDRLKDVNLNIRKAIHERYLNFLGWIPTDVTNVDFLKYQSHEQRI